MTGSHVCGSCETLTDVGVGVLNRCWQPPAGHVDGLLQLPSISRQLVSRCFCGVGHGRDDDQLAITFRRLHRRAALTEVDGDRLAVESNRDFASHPRHLEEKGGRERGRSSKGEEKGDAAQKGNNELRPLLFAKGKQ